MLLSAEMKNENEEDGLRENPYWSHEDNCTLLLITSLAEIALARMRCLPLVPKVKAAQSVDVLGTPSPLTISFMHLRYVVSIFPVQRPKFPFRAADRVSGVGNQETRFKG